MNDEQFNRFAKLVKAQCLSVEVACRLEGMKAYNAKRAIQGEVPYWEQMNFDSMAEQFRQRIDELIGR